MCSFFKKHLHWSLTNLIYPKQTFFCTQRLLSVASPNSTHVPVKGRFASAEQKRIIAEFVSETGSTTPDWDALKKSILSINRGYINEKNINGCILDSCSHLKRVDMAKSFMKYIKSRVEPNLALELLYIRSCYASQDQLTTDDIDEIHTSCKSIFKKNSHLLNSVLLEGIVMGLCCTPAWRDSLEYLKTLKNQNDLTTSTLVCITVRAFKETETDLGWTLMQQIFNKHGSVPLEVIATWFNLCEQDKKFNYQRVLEFLRDNECVITSELAEFIHEKLNQFGSKVTTTIINHKNGNCKNCNQVLKSVEVTDSDFKILQECFMSNVMIGQNIFQNSSPQELQDFKDFIEITAPYDVVVDGLNLAYAYRGKIDNNSLTKIIMKKFIQQKLKVLLIGRKHLATMLGNEFNFIKKNAHIFFTNDLSKDDPFVLYAAMYSGLGTKILTRDLMRSHKFLLGDAAIKNVFQKWLQKHRLTIKIRPGNQVFIKDPIKYLQGSQESIGGVWHLPYQESKIPGHWSKPDSSPDNWMCIQI